MTVFSEGRNWTVEYDPTRRGGHHAFPKMLFQIKRWRSPRILRWRICIELEIHP